MENHRESRKRLRPWLERMINNGECPGLVWENREERTFRIPWRHFNNKEWVEEDSKIFREWAKYTGKYQDGDKVEYPVWKTRLRCALKKIPEIKEIPDMHRIEDANPYRVYKFVDVPPMKRVFDFDSDSCHSQNSTSSLIKDCSEESSNSPPNFLSHKYREDQVNVPTVVYEHENTVAAVYARLHEKKEPPDFLSEYPNDMQSYCDKPSYQPTSQHYNMVAADNNMTSSEPMTTSLPSDLVSVNTADLYELANIDLPTSINSINNHSNISIETQPQNVASVVTPSPLALPSMHMLVYYGTPNVMAVNNIVHAPGCRFYSPVGSQVSLDRDLEETLFGPKNVYQITLPSVDQILPNGNMEQKRLINDLLEKMERGVVLTYNDSDIYVQRLCRTRVYLTDGSTQSIQLDRKTPTLTKAFDYKQFCKEYQEYQQNVRKDLPKPFFILTLGQEIKISHFNPMSSILIYVVVRHDMATKIISQDPNANNNSSGAFYSYDSYDKFLEEVKKVQI